MADATTFPAFEEWKAPWEKNGTDFDADTAKKLIYNMERNAHTAAAKSKADLEAVQTKLTEAETKASEATKKANELEDAQIKDAAERANKQLERKIEELTNLVTKGAQTQQEQQPATITDTDKELAGLRAGLTSEQAKRLVGSTAEELAADAKRYADELGIGDGGGNDFVDDDQLFRRGSNEFGYDDASEHGEMPRGVPARQGHRTNLAGSAASRGNVDPAKARDLIPRR